MFMVSCGTASRRFITGGMNKTTSANEIEPPDIESLGSSVHPKAQEIRAISHKEISSLQLIEKGIASWYGADFHGQLTASGEVYNMHELTAAHRTLPFNTIVLVKNVENGRTVVVRINDRGPYVQNRIIDLSKKAARKLGMLKSGTAHVKLYTLQNALPESSIENIKVATYTIQLASYKQENKAFDHAQRVRGSRVEIAFVNQDKVFRVYYGLYLKRSRASKVLNQLSIQSIDGYVTQVEN